MKEQGQYHIASNLDDQRITMTFVPSEVTYEASTILYNVARLAEASAAISDITADGNVDITISAMHAIFNEVCELLYPLTKVVASDGEMDECAARLQPGDDVFVVTLSGKGIAESSARYIYSCIKQAMVNGIVAEWLALANLQLAATYAAKAENAKQELRSAIAHKATPSRITPHWLG